MARVQNKVEFGILPLSKIEIKKEKKGGFDI